MNRVILLFLAPTLIWGSTWYVITHQLDQAPLEWSVFFRFVIASLAMAAVVWWLKKPFKFESSWHIWFAVQGFFNYCLNYLCTYRAELTVPSGVVAVTFSLMVVFNILGVWIFFRQPVRWQTIVGAVTGVVGLILIFWRELGATGLSPLVLQGLGFALLGTLSASSGNLLSVRLIKSKIPVLSFTFWGMFYGMISALLTALLFSRPFAFPAAPSYWMAVGYLAIFGTVVAFACYMTLIEKIGADRAVYTTVVTPMIALLISTYFESYSWNALNLSGVFLIAAGQIFILFQPKTRPT